MNITAPPETPETRPVTIAFRCAKCEGRGRLDFMSHIEGGRCFRCGGAGVLHLAPPCVAAERAHERRVALERFLIDYRTRDEEVAELEALYFLDRCFTDREMAQARRAYRRLCHAGAADTPVS